VPHTVPKNTCRPCVPTRVKKAEYEAFAHGPWPSLTKWINSYSSIERNTAPRTNVAAKAKKVCTFLFFAAKYTVKPTVKLDVRRIRVSHKTNGSEASSAMLGAPKVWPCKTAWVAKSDANKTTSLMR